MTQIDYLERAKSVVPLVRELADVAEQQRHLPRPIAEAFARLGLYRIAAPLDCHGADTDPLTQMRVIETVSEADGSAGWNLMIGIETFGLVAPALISCPELIADPLTIMASSTAAVGRAERCDDGWNVSGQWQFVSGIHNAQVFGATVKLYENGDAVDDRFHYAIVEEGDYEIVDTWNVSGLRGSGSHDVRIDNVTVESNRIVEPMGGLRERSAQLRLPLGNRLAFNKVAVGLGIARAAIDAFVDLATSKTPRFNSRSLRDRPTAQVAVAKAEARLRGARASVFEQVDKNWSLAVAGEPLPERDRALLHVLCSDAALAVAEVVDIVASASGTTANQVGHPLERLARDARVIRQHATVAPQNMEDAGRVLLGLEPIGVMLRI